MASFSHSFTPAPSLLLLLLVAAAVTGPLTLVVFADGAPSDGIQNPSDDGFQFPVFSADDEELIMAYERKFAARPGDAEGEVSEEKVFRLGERLRARGVTAMDMLHTEGDASVPARNAEGMNLDSVNDDENRQGSPRRTLAATSASVSTADSAAASASASPDPSALVGETIARLRSLGFRTFANALENTDALSALFPALARQGGVSLLVPSDRAFLNLPQAVQRLLRTPDAKTVLKNLLLYHVFQPRINFNYFQKLNGRRVKTLLKSQTLTVGFARTGFPALHTAAGGESLWFTPSVPSTSESGTQNAAGSSGGGTVVIVKDVAYNGFVICQAVSAVLIPPLDLLLPPETPSTRSASAASSSNAPPVSQTKSPASASGGGSGRAETASAFGGDALAGLTAAAAGGGKAIGAAAIGAARGRAPIAVIPTSTVQPSSMKLNPQQQILYWLSRFGLGRTAANLAQSGVLDQLSPDNPVTILAPTQHAYRSLPWTVRQLFFTASGEQVLPRLMMYHVIAERLTVKQLRSAGNNKYPTLLDEHPVDTKVGSTFVRFSPEPPDYAAATIIPGNSFSNRIATVHVSSSVLIPPYELLSIATPAAPPAPAPPPPARAPAPGPAPAPQPAAAGGAGVQSFAMVGDLEAGEGGLGAVGLDGNLGAKAVGSPPPPPRASPPPPPISPLSPPPPSPGSAGGSVPKRQLISLEESGSDPYSAAPPPMAVGISEQTYSGAYFGEGATASAVGGEEGGRNEVGGALFGAEVGERAVGAEGANGEGGAEGALGAETAEGEEWAEGAGEVGAVREAALETAAGWGGRGVYGDSASVAGAASGVSSGAASGAVSSSRRIIIQSATSTRKQAIDALSKRGLTVLAKNLLATRILDSLSGPATILAPTNLAFWTLPLPIKALLMGPKADLVLTNLMAYHILPRGQTSAKQFDTAIVASGVEGYELFRTLLEGRSVKAERIGKALAFSPLPLVPLLSRVARVVESDVTTSGDDSNGDGITIHVINRVLIPPVKVLLAPFSRSPSAASATLGGSAGGSSGGGAGGSAGKSIESGPFHWSGAASGQQSMILPMTETTPSPPPPSPPPSPPPPPFAEDTIMDRLRLFGCTKTADMIAASGFIALLTTATAPNVTFFAPTDDAHDRIPAATKQILTDQGATSETNLLSYQTVFGIQTYAELTNKSYGPLKTILGESSIAVTRTRCPYFKRFYRQPGCKELVTLLPDPPMDNLAASIVRPNIIYIQEPRTISVGGRNVTVTVQTLVHITSNFLIPDSSLLITAALPPAPPPSPPPPPPPSPPSPPPPSE